MMKHIYAYENTSDYEKYQSTIERFSEDLFAYQQELQENFQLRDLPKGIVWTTSELATTTFSTIPIPAFTNKDLIYFSPDEDDWRKLFINQLEGKKHPEIEDFYLTMPDVHIFTILAHELTHHLDLFPDEFDEERRDSIWFEEGMCEYLPRRIILSDFEFDRFAHIEAELIKMFKDKYGRHSLDEFGQASYKGSLTSIMFDYWRSFHAIKYLVEERANHNVYQVFEEYHRWYEEGRKQPLTAFFGIEDLFR
jgi:hypothetical protein